MMKMLNLEFRDENELIDWINHTNISPIYGFYLKYGVPDGLTLLAPDQNTSIYLRHRFDSWASFDAFLDDLRELDNTIIISQGRGKIEIEPKLNQHIDVDARHSTRFSLI